MRPRGIPDTGVPSFGSSIAVQVNHRTYFIGYLQP